MNPAPKNPPTKEDLTTKAWTLEDALEIYSDLSQLVKGSDFILTMHGSILRYAHGNDLDLLAVQWRGVVGEGFRETRFDQLMKRLLSHSGLYHQHVDRLTHQRIHVKLYHCEGTPTIKRIVDLLVVLL